MIKKIKVALYAIPDCISKEKFHRLFKQYKITFGSCNWYNVTVVIKDLSTYFLRNETIYFYYDKSVAQPDDCSLEMPNYSTKVKFLIRK